MKVGSITHYSFKPSPPSAANTVTLKVCGRERWGRGRDKEGTTLPPPHTHIQSSEQSCLLCCRALSSSSSSSSSGLSAAHILSAESSLRLHRGTVVEFFLRVDVFVLFFVLKESKRSSSDMMNKERRSMNYKGLLRKNWLLIATVVSVLLGM